MRDAFASLTRIGNRGLVVCWVVCAPTGAADDVGWPVYGRDAGGSRFSPANTITPANVHRLQPVWQARTGDLGEGFIRKGHSMQTTPVLWDGRLYLSTSANWVIVLDAATGEEHWRFDPQLPKELGYSEHASRGVALWHGDAGDCPDRVFVGTLHGRLLALDARSGIPCADFGDKGVVDLRKGVGAFEDGDYGVTSPPVVFGNSIIVGSAIGDNRRTDSELGIVRAVHAVTGRELWRWDPIPRSPADAAAAGWEGESAARTGAANAWPPLALDAARGWILVPTSSPSPDFYGGERPGDNRYANSIVALDARDGSLMWHRQLVHHDVWDYDNPAQPVLVDLHVQGKVREAVVVVTKTGMMFVLDRANGEPIYPIEERRVPSGGVAGESLSPTQPFSSLPPIADQSPVTEDDAFGVVWFDRRGCRAAIRKYRSEGVFTPPSLEGTLMNPGYGGGANWGGVAVDSGRGLAVTNVNQLPAVVQLIPRDEWPDRSGNYGPEWNIAEMQGTPYVMARTILLSMLGMPCTRPPWGKLVAMDLAAGRIRWEIPLGTVEDLAPAPVPNLAWGVPNMGGPIVTATGLVFIGAAADYYLRAFDIETGRELWRGRLPRAAAATPMTYVHEGRQYVVIAAGGHGAIGLEPGDYVMAFALPDD